MTTGDLYKDVAAIFNPAGNPVFDQILWDPTRHVLSLRYAGWDRYVNVWLHRKGEGDEHLVETNGGPAADSGVLWEDGQRIDGVWHPTIPPDLKYTRKEDHEA